MLRINRSGLAILTLSIAVASLVAGAGVIFMGAMQQRAVSGVLEARVWADGWKSDEEIRSEEGYGAFLDEDDSARQVVGAPQSSLIATKKLVAWGVALLTLGSGLLTWYVAGFKSSRNT